LAQAVRHSGVQSGNCSQCAALFCASRSAAWRWSCQRDFRAPGGTASRVSAIDGWRGPPRRRAWRRDRHPAKPRRR
jgi:hypothetical protein